MAFHGLFIGIDRYTDPSIQWLGGAVRDANALAALLGDTVGDDMDLLVDTAATRDRIIAAMKALAARSTDDDVVVIGFSGHGSDDHHLVTHDADSSDLAGSAISLQDFTDLLAAVPAKTLFCAIDCCFSGGLGAKVLSTGIRARSAIAPSVTMILDRFVGEGRLALTAAADNQEAFESAKHGHGLFTYRLLEALQGAPEVLTGGQVSLHKLIEHVTRMVEADARAIRREQTPTLRGKLDGTPSWPVMKTGKRYAALFPDRVRAPVTSDLRSLASFGFTDAVIDVWEQSIPSLNDLQTRAINDFGLLDGENLVVSAPTSSGKTLVGELAAVSNALARQRAIFLLPMKALVNDKFEHFTRVYGPSGIVTIRATGDHSDQIPEFLRGQFDIALLTYETYAALALGNRHVLQLAHTVVVDEAQILADRSRGSNLEFLLTLLNTERAVSGYPQIIVLSAVVGDLMGLDQWLDARHLHTDRRPVPLVEGVLQRDGSYRRIDETGDVLVEAGFVRPLYVEGSRSVLIPLVKRLTGEGKRVLVFRQSKAEAIACAVYLSQALGLPPAQQALDELVEGDPSRSSETLRTTLAAGVAFHNAELSRDERRVVEEQFRAAGSGVEVIACTPTLAMGVNTPAAAVAIVGLTHPGAVPKPYTVAEYKNMVGRAGRLGFAERGESYLIPEGALDERRAWDHYVTGSLEVLHSQLVPDGDPRTLMLRVIAASEADATGHVTEQDVIDFLDRSFAAFRARAGGGAQWQPDGLRNAFRQLVDARLVVHGDHGYQLTELGRFTGESGTHVDSIARLVHVLRGVHDLNSIGLIAATQLTMELEEIYIPVNAKAKNTEVPRWPGLLRRQGVPESILRGFQQIGPDVREATARAKRAAAAAMWVSGVPVGDIEDQLNQHLYRRGGLAGTVRSVAERTRDLLPAVAAVMRELRPTEGISTVVERTGLRLELGIPASIVDLALAVDITLARADWLTLDRANIRTLEAVRASGKDALAVVLGSAEAAKRLLDGLPKNPPETVTELELPLPTE